MWEIKPWWHYPSYVCIISLNPWWIPTYASSHFLRKAVVMILICWCLFVSQIDVHPQHVTPWRIPTYTSSRFPSKVVGKTWICWCLLVYQINRNPWEVRSWWTLIIPMHCLIFQAKGWKKIEFLMPVCFKNQRGSVKHNAAMVLPIVTLHRLNSQTWW